MRRFNDILESVVEAVAAMLWLDDAVDMELVPCRVNRDLEW